MKKFTRTALPKATLPTPSAFHFFRFTQPFDPKVYDQQRYFDDLVAVYRTELAELAQAGCTYVQMDEVPVAMLCDPLVREQAKAEGGDPDKLLDLYVGVMRRILEDRPPGLTVGMHLCRGNFRSRWMASGGYEPVAARLFNDFPVDVYFLEYDSQRAGDFSPLRHVPKDRRVVLGLVSTKTPVLESPDDLRRRIDEAARFVDLERLSLSSQCGFASVAGGNSIDEDTQWAKLGLIVDTARGEKGGGVTSPGVVFFYISSYPCRVGYGLGGHEAQGRAVPAGRDGGRQPRRHHRHLAGHVSPGLAALCRGDPQDRGEPQRPLRRLPGHAERPHERITSHMEKVLPAIVQELEATGRAPADLSTGELTALARRHGVQHIYFINRSHVVFQTNLPGDMNLAFPKGPFTEFLDSVFSANRVMSDGIDLSRVTGTLKTYSYFGPKGKDYIIETSTDVRGSLDATGYGWMARYFFDELLTDPIRSNPSVKELDIYLINQAGTWNS